MPKRTHHLAFTLLLYVTVALAVATTSNAHVQHRDHASLKRLIRKRAPFPQNLPPVIGAGAAPPAASSTSATSSSSSASSSTSTSPQTSQSKPAASSTSSGILGLPDIFSTSSSANADQSSASTSSTPTSTSSTDSTTSAPTTSEALNLSQATQEPSISSKPKVTFTTEAAASSTNTPIQQTASAKTKSATLTVLIVIVSSVAAVTILWTIFRKWKLGRSRKFDERLNPIDFQPTSAADGAIPGAHRRLSGSSFHSGSGHGHAGGYGYGNDLPDHDFTAGPATLAPVGGYADLARGSSPQPPMQQVNYGAQMNPGYDVGVPLHHQAYASQEAYYDPSGRRY